MNLSFHESYRSDQHVAIVVARIIGTHCVQKDSSDLDFGTQKVKMQNWKFKIQLKVFDILNDLLLDKGRATCNLFALYNKETETNPYNVISIFELNTRR